MAGHSTNHIIPSYCHLPVDCRRLGDRYGSHGSCKLNLILSNLYPCPVVTRFKTHCIGHSTTRCGAGSISAGEQFSASVWYWCQTSIAWNGQLLICCGNSSIENQKRLENLSYWPYVISKLADYHSPLSGQLDVRPAVGWQALTFNGLLRSELYNWFHPIQLSHYFCSGLNAAF